MNLSGTGIHLQKIF